MDEERKRVKDNLFNLQVKLVETRRNFTLTLCIICGATTSFSAALLNTQIIQNKAYLLCSIGFLLFAIGWGIYDLKIDIEKDTNGLDKLNDLLNENNADKIKDFFKTENKNIDNKLNYTLDFMVYPFLGSLVAIFLSFIKF